MTSFPLAKSEDEYRQTLSASEFRMLRQSGTEAPGRGEYHSFFPKTGYFACRACGHPLYSADSKFKDCGWDAFDKCYHAGGACHVGVRPDAGGIEIFCNGCGSHQGHVFYGEGQTATNERHWVNSICIRYVDGAPPPGLKEAKVTIDEKTKQAVGRCAQQ